MDDLIRIIRRLFLASLGFLLACFAASLFLVYTSEAWQAGGPYFQDGWSQDWQDGMGRWSYGWDGPHGAGMFAGSVFSIIATAFIGATAFVPASLAIILAEVLRLRALTYHVLAGGVIALAIVVATWMPHAGMAMGEAGLPVNWNLDLAAGFIGGLVYWLLAGRGSGILPPPRAEAGRGDTSGEPPRDRAD